MNACDIIRTRNLETLRGAELCDADFDAALISYRGGTVRVRFEPIGEDKS